MFYTNFNKLAAVGEIINNFNEQQVSSVIANKDYIQLTKIEAKYYDLFTMAKTPLDHFKIKEQIIADFGMHRPLLTYWSVIFKEKYLLGLYNKMQKETFLKAFKIQILTQLFIATIHYGEKIIHKPEHHLIEDDAIVTNFRLYLVMINPYYLYKYLGVLNFEQARILKRLLRVNINWSVDKTFDYLMIKDNDLFSLKVFNFEKEIIRENTPDEIQEKREYGMLVYHTYMKLIIKFISDNMSKDLH
jgi:hypothetical protein